MKTLILLFSFLLINSVFVSNAHGTTIVHHQTMPEDANELNVLGNALGIAGKPGVTGWPVTGDVTNLRTSVHGVYFFIKDTLKKTEGKDEIWTIRYKVKEINLAGLNLSGNLPNLSFSNLEIFNLGFNNISGNIPVLYFPKCREIVLNRNQLTGPLPKFDLAELTYLGFISNKLSGTIPNINLPKLQTLFLGDNQFEGEIPNFNLPALKRLYLTNNKLTGSIPNFNLPELQDLDIEYNFLTGTIPLFNFPKAWNIRLTANQLTGSVPNFNMPFLSNLALGQNKLTGTIPKFNMPNLILLNLKENLLDGEFDNSGLPKLLDLYIQKNMIAGIPHLKTNSPNLEIVDVSGCNLKFEHIEPNMDIKNFKYTGQQRPETFQIQSGNLITLSVKDTAPHNEYKWRKIKDGVSTIVPEAASNNLVITAEPGVSYFCIITNTSVPGLTINSKIVKINSCINFGVLAFCLENGSWEKKENNTASASGKIYINNLAVFEGSMTLDTLNLAMQANGEFYIQNIPLPGGTTGNYLITKGVHNLKLLGKDGKITSFLNSQLEKTAMLFGTPLKIDDMQFVKKHDTLGVKIGCSVNIPHTSGSCDYKYLGTDIALKDLIITNSGISLGGFMVENLGLLADSFCIKKLFYKYDAKKDILIGGGELKFPGISGVGGGIKFEKGIIDSVAFKAEQSLLKIPIYPPSTFSVNGLYGHIAGLNQPVKAFETNTIDIKLGGIFSDFKSNDLYRVTADGRTIWPKVFEVSGTVEALRPTAVKMPFQLFGSGKLVFDIPNKQANITFNGNFGTLNGQSWLMQVSGTLKADHRTDETRISGDFGGKITLPRLSESRIISWMENYINFPVVLGTTNTIFAENWDVVHGVIYFYPLKDICFNIGYIIDTKKDWLDEDYITFPAEGQRQVFVVVKNKSAILSSDVTKTFVVKKNTDFALIEINSPEKTPVSSLRSPSGKEYIASSPDDLVLYSASTGGKEAFWSILAPTAGDWSISLENPGNNDTIITYLQQKKDEFKFSMTQIGSTIHLTWDVSQIDSGQTVNVMFDNDMTGFDGFRAAKGDAKAGSLSFTLDGTYTDCNYYLYAQLIDTFSVMQSYAEDAIENPLTDLAPPEKFSTKYNSKTGEFDFNWDLHPSQVIAGYILSITDETNKDSIYAVLNSSRTNISLFIENYNTKTAKIESFSNDGEIGCAAAPIGLSTGLEDFNHTDGQVNKLQIFPNPTNGNCTIRYFVPKYSKCEITVFDINGRKIAHPISSHESKGFHEINFQYENLPNGIYLIRFTNDFETVTGKSILSR